MLCECGCGQHTRVASKTDRAAGTVRGQHVRFLPGHNSRLRRPPLREANTGHTSPCLLWDGSLNHAGYARDFEGFVHRRMWEDANGPIPPGMEVDHLCRVRRCVNPAHLELVTHHENVRRGSIARAREAQADPSGLRALRDRLALTQRDLAAALGVAQSLISMWETGRATVPDQRRDQIRRLDPTALIGGERIAA